MAIKKSPICIHTYNLQTTTLWSFPERGNWSTHKGDYPGNWSPHVPRNLILRYTEPGDIVLDCFAGSGTTLIEAQLLDRPSIGVDIDPKAIVMARQRLPRPGGRPEAVLRVGDARDLSFIKEASVNLACAHPPYADALPYSASPADLSKLAPPKFVQAMAQVARELLRVLRVGGHCALLIGDIRRRRHVQPLGFWTLNSFLEAGFVLKEIVVKQQHNCRSTAYWESRSRKLNFLLLAHEYLFIFRKPRNRPPYNPNGL